MRLVFVATNDEKLNGRIACEARRRGLLINVVDDPALCDFIVPSIVRRGKLLLAISTQGACPAYAKRLRAALERQFDQAYGDYVALLARLRRKVHTLTNDPRTCVRLLERLLDEDLLSVIRHKGRRAAEAHAHALLAAWLGDGSPRA
jgi:precorrin-2 dehydrogenase/sirohydrochlorin ferrochelatase